jgi:hypothetical protein
MLRINELAIGVVMKEIERDCGLEKNKMIVEEGEKETPYMTIPVASRSDEVERKKGEKRPQ